MNAYNEIKSIAISVGDKKKSPKLTFESKSDNLYGEWKMKSSGEVTGKEKSVDVLRSINNYWLFSGLVGYKKRIMTIVNMMVEAAKQNENIYLMIERRNNSEESKNAIAKQFSL